MGNGNGKSLEAWIWDAACSIRGAKDAAKFKEFILPLIFNKATWCVLAIAIRPLTAAQT
jgi:type I restriction-modification system DNA methylase subunit